MKSQDWSPLGWTGLISLLSKGLLRIFSNTTVQKQQFFSVQPSIWSNLHIHTWLLEKPQLWLYRLLLAKWYLCFLICCLGFPALSLCNSNWNQGCLVSQQQSQHEANPNKERQINLHNQPSSTLGSWLSRLFPLFITGHSSHTAMFFMLFWSFLSWRKCQERQMNPYLCNNDSILILPGLSIGDRKAEWLRV